MRYLVATSLLSLGTPSAADQANRDQSIANLPRPGYEPRTIVIGSVVVQPTLDAKLTYDDNIFALPSDQVSDEIATISPRVVARRNGGKLDFSADVHGDLIRYRSHPRENVNLFGGGLEAQTSLSKRQKLSTQLNFDRSFERRSDPEAQTDRSRPPALINIITGELGYKYQGAKAGFDINAAVTKIDYLAAADAMRDLRSARLTMRASLKVGKIAVYAEPFINRRDFRLPPARGGVFGDETTTGMLLGVSTDLADKLQANFGAGIFSANPDGAAAPAFKGLALNGRLFWHPRRRTAISLDIFRGDVATVRSGALGRIDTTIGLAIDQEVRHNLIVRVAAGLRNIRYRASADNSQKYRSGEIEARYLLGRHLSLVASAGYTRRSAALPAERFSRIQTTLGLRMAY